MLVSRIQEGASWLVNTSQIKTEALPVNVNISLGDKPEDYQCWKGAFRSEYMCNRGRIPRFTPPSPRLLLLAVPLLACTQWQIHPLHSFVNVMRLYCDAVTYNGIGTFDMYEPVWHGGQASIALMIAAALPELEAVSSSLKSSAGMWVQWVLNNLETEK